MDSLFSPVARKAPGSLLSIHSPSSRLRFQDRPKRTNDTNMPFAPASRRIRLLVPFMFSRFLRLHLQRQQQQRRGDHQQAAEEEGSADRKIAFPEGVFFPRRAVIPMDRGLSFWRCVEKTLAFVLQLDYISFDLMLRMPLASANLSTSQRSAMAGPFMSPRTRGHSAHCGEDGCSVVFL